MWWNNMELAWNVLEAVIDSRKSLLKLFTIDEAHWAKLEQDPVLLKKPKIHIPNLHYNQTNWVTNQKLKAVKENDLSGFVQIEIVLCYQLQRKQFILKLILNVYIWKRFGVFKYTHFSI